MGAGEFQNGGQLTQITHEQIIGHRERGGDRIIARGMRNIAKTREHAIAQAARHPLTANLDFTGDARERSRKHRGKLGLAGAGDSGDPDHLAATDGNVEIAPSAASHSSGAEGLLIRLDGRSAAAPLDPPPLTAIISASNSRSAEFARRSEARRALRITRTRSAHSRTSRILWVISTTKTPFPLHREIIVKPPHLMVAEDRRRLIEDEHARLAHHDFDDLQQLDRRQVEFEDPFLEIDAGNQLIGQCHGRFGEVADAARVNSVLAPRMRGSNIIRFSNSGNSGTRLGLCITMKMPCSRASRGERILTSVSSSRTRPESAL